MGKIVLGFVAVGFAGKTSYPLLILSIVVGALYLFDFEDFGFYLEKIRKELGSLNVTI